MTKYEDQDFNSPDIQESVFLNSSLGKHWCHKLYSIYHEPTSSLKPAMGKKRKKGKNETQKFENVEDKRSFFGKIKSVFDMFLKLLFWWQNLMHHINIFYDKYTTTICLINLNFSKFLSWTLSSFFLSLCICIYDFYSIKPFHFTKTKIYVNPIHDGEANPHPISYSPVTSTNVGISPQNFLTFSFNLFSTLV